MWSDLILAARSLWRNRRRSLTTILAVAIGCVALVVFGGFSTAISLGLETSIARQEGHLHIYPQGYLDYGAANPTDYAIDRPDRLIGDLLEIPELKKRTILAVPVLKLNGIAGNFREEKSKTFSGYGIRPGDMKRLSQWDSFGLGGSAPPWNLADGDSEGAVVGIGLARMLSLCDELGLADCRDPVKSEPVAGFEDPAIKALSDGMDAVEPGENAPPVLDLLAASGRGAPNVVSVLVRGGARQAVSALDDMFVGLNLQQARKLVYGGADKATAIVMQLRSLTDAPLVKALLPERLPRLYPGLEVRDLGEFHPMFLKVLAMFKGVFLFVALVIAVVVLFTVANAVTMSVVERTGEVGTLRALGVRRSGIRRQFLLEGALIGLAGASLGIGLGLAVAELVNRAGLNWTPPSSPVPQPLVLLPLADPGQLLVLWLALIAITVLSSWAPAGRAARQPIVEAIHHV